MAVLVDPDYDGRTLRETLYLGHLVVLTRLSAVGRLVDHIRDELGTLFAPHDPEHAHQHFSREEMASVLSVWKPAFMHSDRAKGLVRAAITEAGFCAETTHYDVPKPRTSFPVGHLTTGIAFAFPWHRDTWYGAPCQQINWWFPVFPIREDNAMSFDLPSFGKTVLNSSATFDYYRNNMARLQTGSQVEKEQQCRPAAIDHDPPAECVVLPSPGSILLFSGAQLHRSIPNTSGRARYSVDFRSVDVPDVEAGIGAPSIDVHCSGTAIRDFRRVADDDPFDEDAVVRWFGPPPEGAMLVFSGTDSGESG